MTPAERDVLAERKRLREKCGTDGDDKHTDGAIAASAAFLAWPNGYRDPKRPEIETVMPAPEWGSDLAHLNMSKRRRQLVIAGALILAEIERLDRADAGST